MPEIVLDPTRLAVYETGAVLITTLTFSEPRDTGETRARVLHSLCAWAIHARAERDEAWAGGIQPIKPKYAAWPLAETNRDVVRLNARMRHRMIAARMALAFLKPAQDGKIPRLPPSLRKLSINRAAEWALGTANAGDAANTKTRLWRPARPVLHLAAAVEVLRQRLAKSGITLDYYHLLWEPAAQAWLVREAQSYETLFRALSDKKQLAIDPEKLIRLRFAGSGGQVRPRAGGSGGGAAPGSKAH
jgi:hypothetical protein